MIRKKSVTILRLLLAINRDDCSFLRLLLATSRDDLDNFFLRTPYSGLQTRAYDGNPIEKIENDFFRLVVKLGKLKRVCQLTKQDPFRDCVRT